MPRAAVLDKLAIGAVQSTSVARHLASFLPNGSSREGPITGGNVRAHLYDMYNNTSLSCTRETASFSDLPYPSCVGATHRIPVSSR